MDSEKASTLISTINVIIFVLALSLLFLGPRFNIFTFSSVRLGGVLLIISPIFSIFSWIYHKRTQQKISERKRKIAFMIIKIILPISILIILLLVIFVYGLFLGSIISLIS